MKWAILIAVMLAFGLAFMLRDVNMLQGLGELELQSASPRALAPAETEREPSPADPPAIKNVYYQYVSETGAVRFSSRLEDVPEDKRATAGRVEMSGTPPSSRREAREARERASSTRRASRVAQRPRVTIYTTSTCPYCRSAMRYMDSIGQPYTNRDVEVDPGAYGECMEKTGGREGVPVIDVDGRIMQGWDRDRLDALLGRS